MNCKKSKKLMDLYKEDELKTSLYRKVMDHIDKCDNCRTHWQKLQVSEKFTESLKNHQPEIAYPEKLTADIIEAIKNLDSQKYKPVLQELPIQWLAIRKVRVAISSILILLALSFIFEYGYILNNITNLEQHISAQTNINTGNDNIRPECFALLKTSPSAEEHLITAISEYKNKSNYSRQDWVSVSKKICHFYKVNQLMKNKNSTQLIP